MELKEITRTQAKEFNRLWEELDTNTGISSKDTKLLIGAYESEELAGYMEIQIWSGVSLLKELFVKEAHRKKGIGRALIRRFEKISKDNSCHKMTIRTSEKHTNALRLYIRQDYRIEATYENDKAHLTWYQMCKFIDKQKNNENKK